MSTIEICGWLVSKEVGALTFPGFIEQLVARIRAAGVPIERVSANLRTRHPELLGQTVRWTRDGGIQEITPRRQVMVEPTFLASPVHRIYETGRPLRVDLRLPSAFPVCQELAAQGFTDYFIQPMHSAVGDTTFASWTTSDPGGFTEAHLALLEGIRPTLALRLEAMGAHLATAHLLRVYLGANASRRVLDGAFVRGSGERLERVIWFCDLRGFTAYSDRTPLEDVVGMLDRYFEAVAGPVAEAGGEVLKFIGDAMLAVFPLGSDPEKACAAALDAARRALASPPRELRDEGLSFGIALHLGEVMYGNLGAANRLDFTVIGPAVNEASRVEGLCKVVGEPLLITERFASHVDRRALRSLGLHTLRGVEAPRELFTLR